MACITLVNLRSLALTIIGAILLTHLVAAQNSEALLNQINASVVTVYTDNGQGSGFFVDRRGYIVTCHHVVEGTSRIRVEAENGAKYNAQIISENEAADLAIIKLTNPNNRGHNYLPITTALPEVGTEVIVLGTPEGVKFLPTIGVILGYYVLEDTLKVIQISRVSSHGSSGSPVVTRQGRVIGVVKAGSKSGRRTYATQIEYLLPMMSTIDLASRRSKSVKAANPAKTAQEYFEMGVKYDIQNRYEEAIDAYKKAIASNPRFPRAYAALGALWLIRKDGRKDDQQAVNYLEKAVRLDADYIKARYLLGLAYFNLGEMNGAVQQCNYLRELGANQADAEQRAKALCRMITEDK